MVTEAHHCILLVLSRWREISLPVGVGSSVHVDSEGWMEWGRGPCGRGGRVSIERFWEEEGARSCTYVYYWILSLHADFEVVLLHLYYYILAP